MPWTTPTLRQVREIVRDDITAAVSGVSMVGNSVLRVMSDANAGLAHLTLRYIDWLARQFLPDTSETEWLDRHGDIWLKNLDGTIGRKVASYANGSVRLSGSAGVLVPVGTRLVNPATNIEYETTEQIFIGTVSTTTNIIALDPGTGGNVETGGQLSLVTAIAGVDGVADVIELIGGTDQESDDELRARVLLRIQQPPMGGCQTDYVQWALAVSGVSRAWSYPLEMGIGTTTIRFMCDELRDYADGFPQAADVERVIDYINNVRPVAVKDFFVVAPIPYPIDFKISTLEMNNPSVREAIELTVDEMLTQKAKPGQTIYASWMAEAISNALGEDYHESNFKTTPMPSVGHLAVLGTIEYELRSP
jgi:uncharacterized phage protein gp47/JayE